MIKLTSLQHPLIKHLVKLRSDSDYREEHHSFVIEGFKPIREMTGKIKKLVYSESVAHLIHGLEGKEKIEVTDAIIKKISGMNSPEGILGEVEMPSFVSCEKWNYILVLDGINDPGNMGTLLRTALALGWQGVYLLPNCCDPYNDKAVRAARGAHFKLPLAKGSTAELEALAHKGFQLLVADLKGEVPSQLPFTEKRILVLGNEAQGPGEEVKRFCQPVTIAMKGDMESLNVAVAGGILLYLLRKEDA